jgi:hypothetical protein
VFINESAMAPEVVIGKRCGVRQDLFGDCLWEGLFSPAISQSDELCRGSSRSKMDDFADQELSRWQRTFP